MTPAQRARFEGIMDALLARWEGRFAAEAEAAAREYLERLGRSSRRQFLAGLRDALGVAVAMDLDGPVQMAALERGVREAVSLIRTIPEDLLGRVREAVLGGVSRGRDLGRIEADLSEGYGITARRARMIARDQCNKVNAELAAANAREAGLTRGEWRHNAASKVARETHMEMDGREFDLSEGLYDPAEGRNVMPGELVNCQCTFCPVVPSWEELAAMGLA
jgi:uncharacterized protein with gpF-like domain